MTADDPTEMPTAGAAPAPSAARRESPTGVASTHERDQQALLAALAERPYQFDFFQAVRLLTRVVARPALGDASAPRPIGHDYTPGDEVVRFRTLPSHSFPQSDVAGFTPPAEIPPLPSAAPGEQPPAEMTVAFLGLTGPAGVLPHHYTQTVIDRLRLKDRTLLNFLDVFNHRVISLFYRAWEKHRVPPLLERARAEGREDAFTRVLFSLVGLGTPGMRNRLEAADDFFLFYSGLFSHHPRNPLSLERMIGEAFGLPAVVQQFQGQWLSLEPPEQTAMPGPRLPEGLNSQLGVTAIAGDRIWSVESKFRIRLGPLSYEAFQRLLPGTPLLTRIGQIVRTYAGPELDFDAQLVLRREEIPRCTLAPGGLGARLGWNTWATSRTRDADAEEPVFVSDGWPSR
jgi:type VI secretion system protein ImpH